MFNPRKVFAEKLGTPDDDMFCKVIHNVFTPLECSQLIGKCENQGFELATVNAGEGVQVYDTDTRNCARVILKDEEEVMECILSRIYYHLPKEYEGMEIRGLNPWLRVLKYNVGEYFKPHYDGNHTNKDETEVSMLTLMLYLNDGFIGGETRFIPDDKENYSYIPRVGDVVVFDHDILHEGCILKEGVKYAARTDVMFAIRDDE